MKPRRKYPRAESRGKICRKTGLLASGHNPKQLLQEFLLAPCPERTSPARPPRRELCKLWLNPRGCLLKRNRVVKGHFGAPLPVSGLDSLLDVGFWCFSEAFHAFLTTRGVFLVLTGARCLFSGGDPSSKLLPRCI